VVIDLNLFLAFWRTIRKKVIAIDCDKENLLFVEPLQVVPQRGCKFSKHVVLVCHLPGHGGGKIPGVLASLLVLQAVLKF
jgi:hypothetical protein